MRKLGFFRFLPVLLGVAFIAVFVLLSGRTREARNFSIDDYVARWEVFHNGRLTHYEFRERAFGAGRLTTRWLNMSTMQMESRTVDATMGEIRQSGGQLSFRINRTTYVYRPQDAWGVTDPPPPAFVGALPILTWFDVGTVQVHTRDTPPHAVTVVMHLAHEPGDTITSGELHDRRIQLQAFAKRYFASRFAEELRPENEARLRLDIRNILNDSYLDQARIRDVDFVRLDVEATL